jgi:hypothetical protein
MDAEGDNLWAEPDRVTTENARYVSRFQSLSERHGFKPTWLTNYEMAESPIFHEFGRDVLQRGTGEIGMHLHAWDSPPVSDGGPKGQAYLIEYPEDVMRAKIGFMTERLQQRFERKTISHRAGRWAMDSRYARLLVAHGYRVDCSVTPHVSWAHILGDPAGAGGTDYRSFPSHPYFIDLDRIDREGSSPLLEVPVSIVKGFTASRDLRDLEQRQSAGRPSSMAWLRPDGRNLDSMRQILRLALDEQWPCVELALHSSELMPGGSQTFQTENDIEALYHDLEALFSEAAERFSGMTLGEFYNDYATQRDR